MPFSRTTATRVPAGTVILSLVPSRLATAGRVSGATGGGADACGPSGCCAKVSPDEAKTKTRRTKSLRVRFTSIPPCCHPMQATRSEEHTSELQSHSDLVCRLLLEKKKKKQAF